MPGITDPSEEYFKDGFWAWDGSVWRKLPLIWGYSEPWRQLIEGTAVGAGDAVATSTPVADGYVYVLQACQVEHNAAANKDTHVYVVSGAVGMDILLRAAAAQFEHRLWEGEIVLVEDDTVVGWVGAPGAGQWVRLTVWGYKMRIAA